MNDESSMLISLRPLRIYLRTLRELLLNLVHRVSRSN